LTIFPSPFCAFCDFLRLFPIGGIRVIRGSAPLSVFRDTNMNGLGTGLIVLIVVGAVLLLFVMYGVGVYNTLVRLRNRLENAFAQIEVQLKRRYDLIPNLVETVKGYMKH
jgi:hypothetical protein